MRRIGRYALFDVIGHGGTATVHLGRLVGAAGFSKTVAIKRMHESVSRDHDVAAMFLDEARISARIRHPNVVAATDFLAIDEETFLVMEYVHGESLSVLNDALRNLGKAMPVAIAVHVLRDVLLGLHAAHETTDERGDRLDLVHRDVSPQNVLVGVDGTARVLDFGIAKALGRLQDTHTGQVKGKLSYMAPEQLLGQRLDRRVDVFAAGVVLWETLVGKRLFTADNPGQVVQRVLTEDVPRLDTLLDGLSPALVNAVVRATSKNPDERFATALDFARELEHAAELVTTRAVGEWVRDVAGDRLARRSQRLIEIERTSVEFADSARSSRPSGTPLAPRQVASIAVQTVASMPAGQDELTRSEIHVRLTPDDTGPSAPGVKVASVAPPPARKHARWIAGAGLAGLVLASVLWLMPESTPHSEQLGAAQPAPNLVVREPVDVTPQIEMGPVEIEPAEANATTELESAQAERPHKPARVAKVRRARDKAKSGETAAKKPAATSKAPIRRAEDLFSRN